MIYKRHANRQVRVAPGYEDDVLGTIRPLSMSCREGVLLLDEELASNDPDADECCGWLDNRHEVFVVAIPGCRGRKLVVSIDHGSGLPPPATLHGVIRTTQGGRTARQLVPMHFGLIDPVWENIK